MKKIISIIIGLFFVLSSSTTYATVDVCEEILFQQANESELSEYDTSKVDLKVQVNNDMRKNVGYFVNVRIPDSSKYSIKKPFIVEFYTGDPACKCLIPSIFVGSIEVYESKVVELWFNQTAGDYKAMAIIKDPYGVYTFTNTAYYEVPKIEQNKLSLDVKINNSMRKNVEYIACIQKPTSVEHEIDKPFIVDFYTGNPNCKCFMPGQYLGSAEIDETGTAHLWFNQKEGDYKARAIIIKTPWGDALVSETIYYTVPPRGKE